MIKGELYLIPTPLGDLNIEDSLVNPCLETIKTINVFVVEELRSARRFLSAAGHKGRINELQLFELNEHTSDKDIEILLKLFEENDKIGLLSEAGLPAVADPGAKLVSLCHRHNIKVHPFVGPSSLMLALMSSGLNGQSFTFCGYLPAKSQERKNKLKQIESQSKATNTTQIFIETPYRNDAMLQDILSICNDNTQLCIAVNITKEDEKIQTKTISQWKKTNCVIGKNPCVFLILG